MSAKILSGREISAEVRQELKQKVEKLKSKGLTPGLVMVRVGEDAASVSYMR
ncbi:bifunctional methylenetetrahydrofolate dehydrogenase/methenyltetrahydrofolate cyclohydrolase, partial [Candidatus Bipolaricaulota bacterium]|nr:bifunctional methylenetetrahydrofolate dehydrogenase/methenyltetrahydrofolate cyclohydrolase [Candidatus Bipolaricaulota bacterium]